MSSQQEPKLSGSESSTSGSSNKAPNRETAVDREKSGGASNPAPSVHPLIWSFEMDDEQKASASIENFWDLNQQSITVVPLTESFGEQQSFLEGIQDSIGVQRSKIDSLEDRLDEMENFKKRVGDLERKVEDTDSLGQEVEKQKILLEDIQETLGSQVDDLDSLKGNLDKFDDVKQRVRRLEGQVGDVESSAQRSEIDIATADFVYRSVIATGVVFSIIAAVVALMFELFVVVAVLIVSAIFFGQTYRRGLKPIHVR